MKKLLAFLVLFWGICFIGFAQNLSNLSTLKVDNLSDAQIEQLIKRAESSGLTPSQLEAMAREQGLSPIEANKLRERIRNLQNGIQGESTGNTSSGRSFSSSGNGADPFDSIRRADPYYDLTPFQKKIFGFKLFHNRNLDFNPSLNLPTPQNYIIGAGDQLLIDVYGASQQSFDLTVTPEGRILVPNLGPIQLGGSTIEAASARIKTSLSRIYSGLLGSNPNTFLQVRLGNIRSIKVSMVGELTKPGTYTLPSFATVFNGLYAAGGPNENGAFRNIQVYRDSRLVATVDIYEFLSKGEQASNITLQDNDVVIVPPVQARVEITGPVRREGFFEVKPNESLADLYIYTGGFLPTAYQERITVRRIEDNQRKVVDVPRDQYSTFSPKDGDEILVSEFLDRYTNRVQISGAVFRPGEYSLNGEKLTVKELINRADGLKPEAFVNRATLYRTNADLTLGAEPIDLKGILNGTAQDIELKNEDLLFIPSRYDIQEEFYVKISGETNIPGTYPYASSMTVGDLILRSGGLLESATNSSIEIARRVRENTNTGRIAEILSLTIRPDLSLSEEEKNMPLMPFDHVFIRRSPGFEREQLVKISGEVIYPGEFAISGANERISDVIKRAGGLTQFAYPKGANLIRRTVYFKDLTEQEKKELVMYQIRSKLDPKKNRVGNEAENILFERLNQKLTEIENQKLEEEEKAAENRLKNFYLSDSLFLDSAINAVRVKEQDLVGIDLEAILSNPGGPEDLILQEGDIIQIPKQLQTVRMVGEVLLPTTTRYTRNQGLKGYISKAGGFTENARRSKTYVIYANGDARRTHSFLGLKFYPNLEPGAEIVVPEKPQRERLSTAGWLGLASSLATIAILVQTIVNN
ncbi:polysaccharide biosynthesis/export family protein [Algoriphagus boseongensis]|uniref:polysaccharide biosynthesis/export family protein n=1 Tax=Algoriphagus boseongensis TaxID=1442587 RepID=UPI001AADEB24|nr:SLBB domain-containing protein [Algoriphagus boseongensis]